MLSIGKVGGGEGDPRYYTRTVAQGREDYYTGQGEAQGTWMGKGATHRGLDGPVDEDDFITALTPPSDSERSLLGFDLTFSAPKSVSILFGVGDPDTARHVRDAHDRAVKQALGYVERNATWTRRGRGGHRVLQGDALTIAAFRHRSSRAGDPQLHTHSVIVNEVDVEDKKTTLFGRSLYAHGRTAGFLYQAALRDELTRSVGVEWEPVANGVAEVKGVPPEVRKAFSRRRKEIREHMNRVGGRSAKSAQVAVLETRRAKDYDVPVGHLRDEWQARAAELGFGRDELHAVLDARAPGHPVAPDLADVADELSSAHGVTKQASTFDRRDVLREWASAHREGASVERLERLADRWVASPHTVPVNDGTGREHLGGARYSTPEMLEVERRLVQTGMDRQDAGVARATRTALAEAVAGEPTISEEQTEMVREITRSGDGVQVVRAAAGTGKTFALNVARNAWEQSDIPVYGCALAARAAVELEQLAGIDATTIARLQQDIAHGYGLQRGSVLIVDEAGMVGSRTLLDLAEYAAETDSKLLLVGDDKQLPELDAGGGFRDLAGRLGAVELRQVRRQVHDWDRDALAHLRDGRISAWAEAYQEHGRITASPTAMATRQALVDDWWEAARDGSADAIMIAHRRTDVAELNALARQRLHRDSRIAAEELTTAGGRGFAVGDRALARRNDRRLEVVNGTRGEVIAIEPDHSALTIRVADGRELTVDRPYLDDEHLDHGYALTAHAAQGATVDHAYVLGSDELYREWGYTALTRHRTDACFYIVSPGTTERALHGLEAGHEGVTQDLVEMLHPSHRKRTAQEARGKAAPPPDPAEVARADAADAEERARALEAERDALPRWRRGDRSELTAMATSQLDAARRWTERAEELRSSVDLTPVPIQRLGVAVDAAAVRQRIANRSRAVEPAVGERPFGFAGRDEWAREAVRLNAAEPPTPARPADLGLAGELDMDF
jgi:conjugative relaxase-like TrwC/TraI family protein